MTESSAKTTSGSAGSPPPPYPYPPVSPPVGAASVAPRIPATAEEALEIGRAHYPAVGSPGGPSGLFVHEFDVGYLIHASWPAPEGPAGIPRDPGGSHIVIAKRDGGVTAVPNFPPESAVEVYRTWHRPRP
ncbi:hypothetical protein [Streptomyces gilvosporeus]|uniref:Uncharacterized protein n=1 Tax=Streptomyces gilvosporeus TaxID=553510 RepID=A0A1V0TRA2_9ACTN|nr:hypothetical protein [Streptomyces gilvosporeus]ARF55421.1 hypothetical protein B1H19_15590 [Streptomyces gilvosporeus]